MSYNYPKSIKNKIKIYLILASVILLSGYFIHNLTRKDTLNIVSNDEETRFATTSPTESIKFTDEELIQYYSVYKDPLVKHVRNALNNYLVGSTNGISESAIKADISDNRTVSGLDSFDKSYYESKYIVFAINDGVMGGKVINIVFQDKPDKLFNVWVYQTTNGSYELRGFWQNMSFDLNEMKKIQKQYKSYLNDSEHAL